MLHNQISSIINPVICNSKITHTDYLSRLGEGSLTRDENQQTHFCVYFLPYNETAKKVFIVHHKKANLWIAPGGHIDEGENLYQTLNREIYEELGVKNFFSELPAPFLCTITPIQAKNLTCQKHYDIWFLMRTDGANFNVDPKEFYDTKWMNINEASDIVIDSANVSALNVLRNKIML
ncbi:MAG: NUDIX domain-containing protein [bacterium]|nr:NUDIX domain-containing protein [bacterium]